MWCFIKRNTVSIFWKKNSSHPKSLPIVEGTQQLITIKFHFHEVGDLS